MKTIPLDAVRNALTLAIVKQKVRHAPDGKPLARFAAYTYYAPLTSVTCRNARPGQRRRHFPGMHLGGLTHGDLHLAVQRARCMHGLQEVRRTWGAGLRALQAELLDGALR